MRFGPWRLTDFLPANGSCSITCKSSSTFFIETNAPFTAWKIFGGMRRGSIGKSQQRRVDVDMKALVPSACLFTWGARREERRYIILAMGTAPDLGLLQRAYRRVTPHQKSK